MTESSEEFQIRKLGQKSKLKVTEDDHVKIILATYLRRKLYVKLTQK